MPTLLTTDSDKQELWDEIQRLRRELEKVLREYEDYRKRHPETVGVKLGKAYELKADAQAPTATDPGTPKKKPGGQPGHQGHARAPPARIDRRRRVRLKECPDCGGRHLSRVQETRHRTVEDAPEAQSVVTEYAIERRYCRDCKRLVEPHVPDALPGAQIGLRAMLIVAWLRSVQRLTEDAVPKVMLALCGLRISTGEVQHIQKQLADAYGPFYASLQEELRQASVKYLDETSWRTNGKKGYMWVFVTKWVALYVIADTRSHEVPLGVLGKDATGTIVSDGFSGYNTLVRKLGLDHQRCWLHILGDAKELAEFRPLEGAPILDGLKRIYQNAAGFKGKGTPEDVAVLKQAMVALLDRPYASHKCASFARNVLKVADQLLLFVTNQEIDGTNNRAERAVRPQVVKRKISGGSRSTDGARIHGIIASVMTSLQLKGIDPLQAGLRPHEASDG